MVLHLPYEDAEGKTACKSPRWLSKTQSSLKAQSQQVSTSYELLQHDLPLRLRQAWLPAVLMH